MPSFRVLVTVTLKPEILDPAGQATHQVLQHLGYAVDNVRIGRIVTLTVEADDANSARGVAERMAQDILANPIMESFECQVDLS